MKHSNSSTNYYCQVQLNHIEGKLGFNNNIKAPSAKLTNTTNRGKTECKDNLLEAEHARAGSWPGFRN